MSVSHATAGGATAVSGSAIAVGARGAEAMSVTAFQKVAFTLGGVPFTFGEVATILGLTIGMFGILIALRPRK